MEDVIYVRVQVTYMQMQMGGYRSQEFGKNSEGSGKAKWENFPSINNELPCQVPEGKPKLPPLTEVNQVMQIGVVEIQPHHSPSL